MHAHKQNLNLFIVLHYFFSFGVGGGGGFFIDLFFSQSLNFFRCLSF